MELLLGLLAFVLLDVVALVGGFDSRDAEREEIGRMEREAGVAAWRA